MKRITKEDRFDIFYNGVEYMDQKNLTAKEVDDFLCDMEYIHGQKWTPIFLSNKNYSKPHFFHIVYTLWLHNYIVCYHGEIERAWVSKELSGKGSILPEVLESDYQEKQERKRIKYARANNKC